MNEVRYGKPAEFEKVLRRHIHPSLRENGDASFVVAGLAILYGDVDDAFFNSERCKQLCNLLGLEHDFVKDLYKRGRSIKARGQDDIVRT